VNGKKGVSVLALAAVVLAAGCGGGGSNAGGRHHAPPQVPPWIAAAAARTAKSLGDPSAKVVSYTGGRFPVVVLTGTFTCNLCSRPSGVTPVQTGHYVALRFDAVTKRDTDFSIASSLAEVTSGVGDGSRCTTSGTFLDSAFRALYAHSRGIDEPFDHRLGSSHCKIRLPVKAYKWIWGHCSVSLRTDDRGAIMTFRETWNGLDPSGRRYSPLAPVHHHTWTVTESRAGFVTQLRSAGDYPPQWRH
jgi:hypothetical protein